MKNIAIKYGDGLIKSYTRSAYLYPSGEEYLLSFMDKYASLYGGEVDDNVLSFVYDNALDHNGKPMQWYTSAQIGDVVLKVGDNIPLIKEDETQSVADIISISNDGVYFKIPPNDDVYFAHVDGSNIVYDKVFVSDIDNDEGNAPFYIILQLSGNDIGYKEGVYSANPDVAKKRAEYILKSLSKLLPCADWSVRVVSANMGDEE